MRLLDRFTAAARAFRGLPAPPADADGDDPRLADYPPPYPVGWYRVANTTEVGSGQVLPVRCVGRELVAFRGADSGAVSVLDAHCPHQGAHLGVGGVVVGDCLRCPFHHWRFDRAGRVAHVPGVDRPPRVGVRRYPTREVDGMIWMFWAGDAQSAHDAEAPYEPEVHADVASGQLRYRGQHDAGVVRMHLVEFAENSVDFQHFQPLHGRMFIPWTSWTLPALRVEHVAGWELDPARPWVARFTDDPHLTLFGRPIPRSGASARITLFGPGGVVYFRFTLPGLGDILLYQTHTPEAPMRQRVYFRWFADRRVPRALVSYVVGSWVAQWREDIAIWEHKVYRRKPVLSKVDGPVHQMRRWYAQFYPDEARSARVGAGTAP